MSLLGIEEKVADVRKALIKGLRTKAIAIMTAHADKPPEQIPKHDLARSMVLNDIAEILLGLKLEEEKAPSKERGR